MKQNNTPQIEFLSSAIGRGHPFYLDGVYHALQANHPDITTNYTTVFDISQGASFAAWKLVRSLYIQGASNPLVKGAYQLLRRSNDYNAKSLMLDVLGRDIWKRYRKSNHPLVVDHPLLVGLLHGRDNLYYQHGEMVVPVEALVKGAKLHMVPTEIVAKRCIEAGFIQEQLFVSGLCIEPELVALAETAYEARQKRLQQNQPLTGAFFSSGAEPKNHIVAISKAAQSAAQNGYISLVFAQRDGKLEQELKMKNSIMLLTFSDRQELHQLTVSHFPHFDFFVAPSHERSNWAVGLGLPMFIVEPAIGTFSPLNRELLLQHAVAVSLNDTTNTVSFGERLSAMRKNGQLAAMSRAGWGKYPIDGFARIASFLASAVRPI